MPGRKADENSRLKHVSKFLSFLSRMNVKISKFKIIYGYGFFHKANYSEVKWKFMNLIFSCRISEKQSYLIKTWPN